jgi:DNA repair protein RecN (Recombination protein N)
MLRELHVKNLAVLAQASVELDGGLNVLTGETGAGKSIVVDSLSLLAGARAASELIRTGADTLTVTGVFAPRGDGWRQLLAEAGVDETPAGGDDGGPPELLVRREISRSGRNRVFVNDQPTTLRLLSDLAPHLLRIYGQREEMGLLDPDLQRRWLDASGGDEAAALLERTAAAYEEWRRRDGRLRRLTGDERARRERLDLLRFQVQELGAAELVAGEEAQLRTERDVLRNREAITTALGGAYALLYDDDDAAVDRIGRGQGLLEGVAEWEPKAAAAVDELEELRVRLEELSVDLRRRLDGLDADPGRLDQVEDRLARLERLFRKYGVTTAEELLARQRRAGEELAELEVDAEGREELEREVAAGLEEYRRQALALSAGRRAWGGRLVAAIGAELGDLGLGKAKLAVRLERRRLEDGPLALPPGDEAAADGRGAGPVEFGPTGIDQVVFDFAPNPGEEPRPLSLIASGGELSRIYLALQLAVLGGDLRQAGGAGPTLVFDEVDVGIGGAQAAALGRKLQRLAAGYQVLVVTHLPQVASFADHHFKVAKEVRGERTFTRVEALGPQERTEEVARMLAGERTTDLSLSHARELIGTAAEARTGGAG